MSTILVRALRDFDFEGVQASQGQVLEVTPIQAAMLGRAHHVNLSERPERPDPDPVHEPTPEPPIRTRRTRTYKTRALRAEA